MRPRGQTQNPGDGSFLQGEGPMSSSWGTSMDIWGMSFWIDREDLALTTSLLDYSEGGAGPGEPLRVYVSLSVSSVWRF